MSSQLLMLLLVIDADLDEARDLGRRADAAGQQPRQRLVDMRAIGQHLLGRGARQHATLGARLPGPLALVIGVEAVVERGVESPVVRQMLGEDEGLEEPGDVGQVPLGRAGVVHGLDGHVLGRQRRGELQGKAPRLEQALLLRAMQLGVGLHRRYPATHVLRFLHSARAGSDCPIGTTGEPRHLHAQFMRGCWLIGRISRLRVCSLGASTTVERQGALDRARMLAKYGCGDKSRICVLPPPDRRADPHGGKMVARDHQPERRMRRRGKGYAAQELRGRGIDDMLVTSGKRPKRPVLEHWAPGSKGGSGECLARPM